MSYAHGFQEPSSLPADYAILHARFNTSSASMVESDDDEGDRWHVSPTPTQSSSRGRRLSVPSTSSMAYFHPARNASMSKARESVLSPRASFLHETTPLLHPDVPRIHEPVSGSDAEDNQRAMFWQELKILSKYSLPVFGTHLLEYSLVMASVVSIGHLGTTPLAAITLGTMTANVTAFSIFQGMVSALDTVLPPAWTSPQPNLVGLWTQRMAVIMAALLIPVLLVWFNAESLLLLLKQDPDVARLAGIYLRWVSFGLPAYAFNLCTRRYFQAQGLFAVPTRIILFVAPINAILNYLLVWGPPPIRLGFVGAPVATAISLNLVSIASLTYGIWFVPRTAWYPLGKRMFKSLGLLVSLGVGGVGQTASEWWAWELVALAASQLGPSVLATQSILLTSASCTFQAPFALSVATSVRIGNLLGERNPRRAGVASNTSLVLALIIAVVWSVMFMAAKDSWGRLFNDDPVVVGLVAKIIPMLALFQVADGIAAVTAGILRARGKQLVGALLNLSSYYIVGIPLGIFLTFNIGMGLPGLWIGLTVSLAYCAAFGLWLCVRTDWEYEVQKVLKRLAEEQKMDEQQRSGMRDFV